MSLWDVHLETSLPNTWAIGSRTSNMRQLNSVAYAYRLACCWTVALRHRMFTNAGKQGKGCAQRCYLALCRLASRHSLEEEICSPCNTLITLYTLRMPELLPRLATPDVALYAAHWQVSGLDLHAADCHGQKSSLGGP